MASYIYTYNVFHGVMSVLYGRSLGAKVTVLLDCGHQSSRNDRKFQTNNMLMVSINTMYIHDNNLYMYALSHNGSDTPEYVLCLSFTKNSP